MKSEIILALLWLAYGFVHTALAMNWVKNIFKGISKYYRLIYNGLAVILLLPILNYQFSIPSESLLEKSLLNQILGGLMMTSGLFLAYKALVSYDLAEFIGTKTLQPVQKPISFRQDELSSVIRHPLYLGILVFLWGWFGFSGLLSSLVSAISLTVYIRIGIYFEEKKLVEQFGKVYQDYQQKVPMLIPRFEEGK
jgi:protein-S-isoprenylcysteine O-methyltransferase Ste14